MTTVTVYTYPEPDLSLPPSCLPGCGPAHVEIYSCASSEGMGFINTVVYIGVNLGTGAEVYESTDQAADPREHKFRSLISSDNSVTITQLANEIDFAVDLGGGGSGSVPEPGTTFVGATNLVCGATLPWTPSAESPSAAAGDLAIMFAQPRITAWADYANAAVIPPTGWSVYVPSMYSAPSKTHHNLIPGVFYKFLTAGDINTTHIATEANSRVDYLCGAVLVYRNVNTQRPFGARVNNAAEWQFESGQQTQAAWGGALPIYSTQQHVVCLWNEAGGTGAGNSFTRGNTPSQWPLYDPATMPDFAEVKFGVQGAGGDNVTRTNSVATWAATIANDENLIPYENNAQSVTSGTWQPTGLTVGGRTLGSKYTVLTTSGLNQDHYVEFEQAFTAGEKITFAPFVYAANGSTKGYWVAIVSPDSTIRAQLFYMYASSPGWRWLTKNDPLSDYGTVWVSRNYSNDADGVPEIPVGVGALYMIAPQTGTYKFRIYVHGSNTNISTSWAERTGTAVVSLGVTHVLLRHGLHTPTRVPTAETAVIAGTSSFSTPTRGWAIDGAPSHLAFALNPAWTDNLTPLANMSAICNSYSAPEGGFVGDGATLSRWRTSATDDVNAWTSEQPIYPIIDGVAQKYYCEVEVQTDLGYFTGSNYGDQAQLSVGFGNAILATQNSSISDIPSYGFFYNRRSDIYDISYSRLFDPDGTADIAFAIGDVIGVEVDFAALTVKYYQNGVLFKTMTIFNGFPGPSGANYDGVMGTRNPWYFQVAISGKPATVGVRLRQPWLRGPSAVDILPFDAYGSSSASNWSPTISSTGGGAQIIYQDPATGVTSARSITGGDGIEVIQYGETVDVALKISELTSQTPVPSTDYAVFFDASTGGHSKALLSNLLPLDGLSDVVAAGAPSGALLQLSGSTWNAVAATAVGVPADPYASNVVAFLHFDGANNGTVFTDETGKVWTRPSGTVITSTAQSVFGGASGYFPGDYANSTYSFLQTPDSADFDFGSGDFTIEARINCPIGTWFGSYYFTIASQESGFNSDMAFHWDINNAGTTIRCVITIDGGTRTVSGAYAFSANTWYAVAVARVGTNLRLFVNGTLVSTLAIGSGTLLNSAQPLRIGHDGRAAIPDFLFRGYVDEFRITKGVGRYSASYTVADAAFPGPTDVNGFLRTDNLWDAKGDLVVGTGANTAAKLPVGTNTQILVADSTTATGVKWAAPSAGTPTANGAQVSRSASKGTGDINWYEMDFDTEEQDTNGYWTVGSPSRFTIPGGASGWYVISFIVCFDTPNVKNGIAITKNATTSEANRTARLASSTGTYGASSTVTTSCVAYLAAADYVHFGVYVGTYNTILLPIRAAIHRLS